MGFKIRVCGTDSIPFNLLNKSKLSRQFLRYTKGRPFMKTNIVKTYSLVFFYFLCHAFNIKNQRRLSSCLSIPMFIGTPYMQLVVVHGDWYQQLLTRSMNKHAITISLVLLGCFREQLVTWAIKIFIFINQELFNGSSTVYEM